MTRFLPFTILGRGLLIIAIEQLHHRHLAARGLLDPHGKIRGRTARTSNNLGDGRLAAANLLGQVVLDHFCHLDVSLQVHTVIIAFRNI